MSKPLSDMTMAELWQLFPIELAAANPLWEAQYRLEAERLRCLLGDVVRLHHIGSTAIGGIMAKPIVDLLAETDRSDFDRVGVLLEKAGYTEMARSETRRDYNRGYTPQGFAAQVFHLHLRVFDDADECLFRDYLITHPNLAASYEALKKKLAVRYRYNRDAYTEAKGAFVRAVTERAKKEIGKNKNRT